MPGLPRLFHGTSFSRIGRILEEGVRPSGELGHATYGHMRPLTGYVYLASFRAFKYATFLAENEAEAFRMFRGIDRAPVIALFEIDTALLDASLLRVDDDYYTVKVADLGRDPDAQQARMDWAEANPDLWEESLDYYGTVAYKGMIAPSAIKKVGVLALRDECALSVLVRKLGTITSKEHWHAIKDRHEATTRGIMGEGVRVEELLRPEERDLLKDGIFQASLDAASLIVYERDDQGAWFGVLRGDHSMFKGGSEESQ